MSGGLYCKSGRGCKNTLRFLLIGACGRKFDAVRGHAMLPKTLRGFRQELQAGSGDRSLVPEGPRGLAPREREARVGGGPRESAACSE